jgi:hypothetical protein
MSTTTPGPGGYGIIPPDPPAAAEPEPLTGTVAVRPADAPAAPDSGEEDEPKAIDGMLLWLFVRRYLARYVAFRTQAELDMVTAWIFHACARNRNDTGMGPLIWNATPRLLILSRKRGAGKSTLLTLISILTGSISGKSARITAAAFAQSIAQAQETVCIDEGRLVFGSGAAHQDLQALIIDGYTPESTHRVSKTRLSVFGPVAIASKESLITEATKAVDGDESSIGDLLSRCLKVILEAPDLPMPEIGRKARAEGTLLARALVMWTDNMRGQLEQAAEDVADKDYEEAHEAAQKAAGRGERIRKELRADQIGRPLRCIGRIIDWQVIEDRRQNGIETTAANKPQCEAKILAALGVRTKGDPGVEAAQIMAELEQLSQGWEDGAADLDEDEGWIASTSGPGDYEDEPEPAPAGQYRAGYGKTRPGKPAVQCQFTETWASLEDAQQACADDSGGPLHWERHEDRELWTATVYESGGIEVAYSISAAGE